MQLSQQLAQRLAQARSSARPEEVGGKVRIITFDVLVTEPGKEFRIAYLPGGRGRLLTTLGRVSITKGNKAVQAVISLGHEGYTSGMLINSKADYEAFSEKTKVTGLSTLGSAKNVTGYQYDSMSEVGVVLSTEEPLDAGAEIHGMLFYVID